MRDVFEVSVGRDKGGADPHGGGGDSEIGDGRPFAFATEVPAKLADLPPEAWISGDFGHDVKELLHLTIGLFDLDPAQDFGPNDPAIVKATRAQDWGKDLARIFPCAHKVDVSGGVDEVVSFHFQELLFGPRLPSTSAGGVGDGGGVVPDGDDVIGRIHCVPGLIRSPGFFKYMIDGGNSERLIERPVHRFLHGADPGHFHDPVEFDLVKFNRSFHMALNMGIHIVPSTESSKEKGISV